MATYVTSSNAIVPYGGGSTTAAVQASCTVACDFYYMAPAGALPQGGTAASSGASATRSYRIALYTSPVWDGGTSGQVLVRLRGPKAGDPYGASLTTRLMAVNGETPLTP